MSDWVDLHHHSEYSLLDGYGSVQAHVQRAKELGHPAVAFTEHGTARGFAAIEAATKEAGVRPIFGIEFYVTRNHRISELTPEQKAAAGAGLKGRERTDAVRELERSLGIPEARHLVAIALNDEGVQNLIRLNNIANTRGLRVARGGSKPRIDLDLLCEYNEGIAISTACLGGVAALSWMDRDYDRLVDELSRLRGVFGRDRLSLEIQPHDIKKQREWNLFAIELGKELDIPLIATNDSHYVCRKDWESHDALITMRFGKTLDDPDRIRYVEKSFAIKSVGELEDSFDRYHPDIPAHVVDDAIDRACDIADRARGGLWKPKTILLPSVTDEDPDTALRKLCLDGWDWRDLDARADRIGEDPDTYVDRLSHELGVIRELGFARYFLVVHDMISWARRQGIIIGPGRGSAAGSLVCFLLGITALDPVEHELLFERFLTPGRADWPDIDVDVERDRRGEVLTYLRERHGYVAQIGTITRMRGRTAFRDVARVHGVPYAVADDIANAIVGDTVRDDEDGSIAEALATSEVLQDFRKRYPEVIAQALDLEGHVRQVGIHAAGVICSPVPLDAVLPLETRVSKGEVVTVTAYDMHEVERSGYIKIDVLGLKTLSTIGTALASIEERRGVRIDLESLTLDDPEVIDRFTKADFIGVFQFDTPSAHVACEGVRFESFQDIAAMNAINRPGPSQSGLGDTWRKRKGDVRARVKFHPQIDRICRDSYGVIIYQEHIIRILQNVGGFSPAVAGKLRKLISKSKGESALDEYREQFVDGAERNGLRRLEAETLWGQIGKFGRYGFNKSHAAAYAQIAYWCQWLKVKYPIEFFGALLSCERDVEKANRIVREAARRGVEIEPPDVNRSELHWKVESGSLLASLSGIKGVGENACSELLAHRPYADVTDLLARVNRRVVTKGVLEALVKAGALRGIWPNTAHALENLSEIIKLSKRKNGIELVERKVSEGDKAPRCTPEDEWAYRLSVGVAGSGRHPLGVLGTIDKEILRNDWGDMGELLDGALIRGVVSNHKIGTRDGARWARIELEDERGNTARLKFDDDGYNRWGDIIALGNGALVAARVRVRKGQCYPEYLVDLLDLRSRWNAGETPEDWTTWERCLLRPDLHPVSDYKEPWNGLGWKSNKACLVTHVKTVLDSNRRRMAFVRFEGLAGLTTEGVVFASAWETMDLVAGDIVRVTGSIDQARGSLIVRGVRPA